MTRWLVVLGAFLAGCGGSGGEAESSESTDSGPSVDAGMICVQGAPCSSPLKGEEPIVGNYEACTTFGPVSVVPSVWAFDAGARNDIVSIANDDAGRVTWTLCNGQ